MDLRQLRILVAAVESGSFAAAGARVGLSHSAVSLRIKALEAECGAPLFDRARRPPRPTARGLALAERARKALALFDAARAVGTGAEPTGRLTLGAVPTALASMVPPALAALRAARPELRIELRSGGSAELAERLRRGELDLAVVTKPEFPLPGLEWREIAREPCAVIAPAGAAGADDAALLTGHPFIWFNRNSWAGRGIEAELARRGLAVDAAMEVDSLEAIALLVSAGLGVSIVPVRRGAHPFPPGLRAVPFGAPPYAREIGALLAPGAAPEPLVEALLAALRSAGS